MTPKFCVNAWLERENPILELRESFTNRTVFSVKGELLRDWIDSGEIDISDFNDYESSQEVIKELLLKSITVTTPVYRNNKVGLGNIINFPKLSTIIRRDFYWFYKNSNIFYLSFRKFG